jgi:hypothetical protein
MTGQPEVVLNRPGGRKKVSVILIDWGVRESFHAVEYLNRQTAARADYELIWVEFYRRKPQPLEKLAEDGALDRWIVLGYPDDTIYHKHRVYNVGLLAASGDVCVICDSDAIFRPTFIDNVVRAFEETAYAVVHIDEVRNVDQQFYPFNYPSLDEVHGPGCINWFETTTRGLYTEEDRLHRANYGACMAARRSDLLSVGGSDEHIDYLGFCCGPYEMTFRLQNRGRRERWLTSEYLYHTWHPNQTSWNTDYQAPHDGRFLPLRSLHARATGRVRPYQQNPAIGTKLEDILHRVATRPEPDWVAGAQPVAQPDFVYQVDRDDRGFDLFVYKNQWLAIPTGTAPHDPAGIAAGRYPHVLTAGDEESLRQQIDSLRGADRLRPPPNRWQRFRRDLFGEPLHQLPRRVWRTVRRKLTPAIRRTDCRQL